MTVSLYTHRNSPIHRMKAIAKILLMAIAGIMIFQIHSATLLAVVLILVGLLFCIAKLPWPKVLRELRFIVLPVLTIVIIHCLFNDWLIGLLIALRFSVLMLLALIVTLTTRTSEMIEALEQLLQPLAIFGVNTSKVSMMVSIAIRFIPVLIAQFRDIQDAQRARGLDNPSITLILPLFVKTLRMANDLTDALDARCYDIE